MQQQVGIACFGQGRAERGHQFMRQIAHETDRVRQHQRPALEPFDAAHGRIQGREQLVGDEHARLGEHVDRVDLPAFV